MSGSWNINIPSGVTVLQTFYGDTSYYDACKACAKMREVLYPGTISSPAHVYVMSYGPDSYAVVRYTPPVATTPTSSGVRRTTATTKNRGTTIFVKVYAPTEPITGAYCSSGATPTCVSSSVLQSQTEEIVFTNGEGSVAYPIATNSGFSVSFKTGSGPYPTFEIGKTRLFVKRFKDKAQYYVVQAKVTYYTSYSKYKVVVPSEWDFENIYLWFTFTGCETRVISTSVPDNLSTTENAPRDITILVKDHITEISLSDVSIYIDGHYEGKTNSNGSLTIQDVSIGDHTIRMTRTNYYDSDEDELDNDEFTVSSAS